MSPKADACSGYSGAVLRYLVDSAREVTVPAGVLLYDEDQGRIWFRLPREGERIAGVEMAAARSFLAATQSTIEEWQRSGTLPYAKERLVPLSNAWWGHVRGLLQWSVCLGPIWALAGGDPEEELEAFYERAVTAERDVDALASRLACIREEENGREIRFVLGRAGSARRPIYR